MLTFNLTNCQDLVPAATSSCISHHTHTPVICLSFWPDLKWSFQEIHVISQPSCENILHSPRVRISFLHPLHGSYSFFEIQIRSFLRETCLTQVQVELDIPPLTYVNSHDFQTILLSSILALGQEVLKVEVDFHCSISSVYRRTGDIVGVLWLCFVWKMVCHRK